MFSGADAQLIFFILISLLYVFMMLVLGIGQMDGWSKKIRSVMLSLGVLLAIVVVLFIIV